MSYYDAAKDFAAPVATVIAACVAAYFVRRQARTAEAQAKTALDQLRYQLFDRRYAIYSSTADLLRLLVGNSHNPHFNAQQVIPFYLIMDEARFFFSTDLCDWLASLKGECENLIAASVASGTDPGKASHQSQIITKRLFEMPTRFGYEMQFRQLTGGNAAGGLH
jgi:hypothetical protein